MTRLTTRTTLLALAAAVTLAPGAAAATKLSSSVGMRIDGHLWRQHAGTFVAAAGDVNGDGRADVLIGTAESHRATAPRWNAYVVFGRRGGAGGVLRLDHLGSRGLRIVVAQAPGFVSGAGAGDVNGDGLADVVLGSGQRGTAAYVVYGRRHGGTIDVGHLGRGGFRVRGLRTSEPGIVVAGAGDVDRDGFADVVVGDPGYVPPGGEFGTGRAVVVFGARRSGTLDLDHLGHRGATIIGPGPFHALGRIYSVGFGRALAGLGGGDVAVGAPYLGGREGGGFVVKGIKRGASVDLRAPRGDWYKIIGSGGNAAGYALAPAGDINGDGTADLLVGEFAGGDALAFSSGPSAAYVAFGHGAPLDDATLGPDPGPLAEILADPASGDRAGQSVAGAGDVTGDGVPDLLVGAPLADPHSLSGAGSAFLVPGPVRPITGPPPYPRGTGRVDLIHTPGVLRYDGRRAFDTAGWSVAGVGDVNGDDRPDMAIGVPRADPVRAQSGSVYLVYGAPPSRR